MFSERGEYIYSRIENFFMKLSAEKCPIYLKLGIIK